MESMQGPVAKAAFAAAVIVLLAAAAFAGGNPAAGSLDPSFGHDGRVVTGFKNHGAPPGGSALPRANAVLIDSKGRTVAVGSAYDEFALARYRPSGRLDPDFSHDGKAMTDASGGKGPLQPSGAYAAALDSHGRIVAAGMATSDVVRGRIALVRYRPTGRLDPSFGSHGIVRTAFPGGARRARGVAIDSGGRIVIAGLAANDFALARYLPNGRLDRSFGTDGRVTTSFSDGADEATSLGIDGSGRIVAAGYTQPQGQSPDFALARYLPDGRLDRSFGIKGKVSTDLGGRDLGRSLAIDSRGRMVVVGESGKRHDHRFALARYLNDGSLDASFGGDGEVMTAFNGQARAAAVAMSPRHRIVAAGRLGGGGIRRFALARYAQDGRLDHRFSGNGKVTTAFGDGTNIQGANAIAIGGRERIVAAGYAGRRFGLTRYFGGSR